MKKDNLRIALVCGGSGGHVYPAVSVAEILSKDGHNVYFVGSGDYLKAQTEKGYKVVIMPASAWNNRSFFGKIKTFFTLAVSFVMCVLMFVFKRPNVVFSTGGYASVAPVFAAKFLMIKVVIHEQNAFPGKANRLLSKFADVVLVGFMSAKTRFKNAKKVIFTGNPLRQVVFEASAIKRDDDGKLHLLIFGGSQGASVFNVVPDAVSELTDNLKSKLIVTHQARKSDIRKLKKAYKDIDVEANVSEFFNNLPELISKSHLVISRAGASAVCEIATLQRVAIFVPLKGLADDHQKYNAESIVSNGGAIMIEENDLTPILLAKNISNMLKMTNERNQMENRLAELVHVDAASKIVKIIEKLGN